MITVTDISQFKGKTLRVDFSEGDPIFIHADIAFEYHLKKDMTLPESAVEELVRANDTRRAKERALYLLDERDYSYIELFKKLEANYDEDICYEVCNYLASLKLINDRHYAEKLAEHYCLTKKYGYYRAREQMRARGLSNELIDEALEPYQDGNVERICEVIAKKYARYLGDEKGITKVKSALVRLGYTYSDINLAIEEFLQEEE